MTLSFLKYETSYLKCGAPTRRVACEGSPAEPIVDWVSPFIGTGGNGNTYPGATAPSASVKRELVAQFYSEFHTMKRTDLLFWKCLRRPEKSSTCLLSGSVQMVFRLRSLRVCYSV